MIYNFHGRRTPPAWIFNAPKARSKYKDNIKAFAHGGPGSKKTASQLLHDKKRPPSQRGAL